jgi:hypothetical protein
VVIAAFFGWVAWRSRGERLSVPQWGFLAALGTSISGGVLGVLLGVQLVTAKVDFPSGLEDAHPATMVVGFLVPVALAMVEWAFFFPRPPVATRAGKVQMIFPFAGGLVLMIALLIDVTPLAPVAVLLEIVGIIIFVVRLWPRFREVDFMAATPHRHALMGAVGVVFVIGLAQFFIARYDGDFDKVPPNELLALDHAEFIGAMTNSIFAMIIAATFVSRRDARLDHAVFFLVNIGIIGFVIGLLGDVTFIKRLFAPIMGIGLLIGLGTYAWRLLPGLGTAEELPATGWMAKAEV